MIIIMERDATAENIKAVTDLLNEHGFRVIVHEGDVHTVIDALVIKQLFLQTELMQWMELCKLNLFVNHLD